MEVEFEPYKKITFQSHMAYKDANEFVQAVTSGVSAPPGIQIQARLFWANGILFRHFAHPPSEALSKELLSGHIIFDHIEFAPMETFSNDLKIDGIPGVTVAVLDVSKHVVFDPLTKYIRDNLLAK
jgi:hypothetical protein